MGETWQSFAILKNFILKWMKRKITFEPVSTEFFILYAYYFAHHISFDIWHKSRVNQGSEWRQRERMKKI